MGAGEAAIHPLSDLTCARIVAGSNIRIRHLLPNLPAPSLGRLQQVQTYAGIGAFLTCLNCDMLQPNDHEEASPPSSRRRRCRSPIAGRLLHQSRAAANIEDAYRERGSRGSASPPESKHTRSTSPPSMDTPRLLHNRQRQDLRWFDGAPAARGGFQDPALEKIGERERHQPIKLTIVPWSARQIRRAWPCRR
jgi:hypothetical protein